MNNKKYIGYYRVSTIRQGKSGLGLESQRQSVQAFVNQGDIMLSEYTDVESGKNNNRPNLTKALQECKETGATLLIAKLDRLSRNAAFTLMLRDSNINFVAVDNPDINSLTIGILALVAQDEAERISKRVVSALGVIQAKFKKGLSHTSKEGNVITSLGSGNRITDKVRLKGMEVRVSNAKNNPESIKAGTLIISLKESGKSFYAITKVLNTSGFTTPKGGKFSQVQTQRLYERYILI